MNSRRIRNVRRQLNEWHGPLTLLCALISGSILVLWLNDRSTISSSPSSRGNRGLSLSGKLEVNEALKSLDLLLYRLPVAAFIMEQEFLDCLRISSATTGGQFCLGILMEKEILHFGAISWQNDSARLFSKDSQQRACLVRDITDCPGGLWCGKPATSPAGTVYTAAFILEVSTLHGSVIRHQTVYVTVFQEYSRDYWISIPSTDHAVHECSRATLALDDNYSAFTERLAAPQSGRVFKRFGLEFLRSESLTSPLLVPANAGIFLQQLTSSKFVSCNSSSARSFPARSQEKESEDRLFRSRVRSLLLRVQKILDDLNLSWWLSSGTCLGWYRQCDIIPYSQDVDIGMWIKDFRPSLIDSIRDKGMDLVYRLGLLNDSLQLSFVYKETKLDVYFFYEEGNHVWNGATAYHAGQKFKYTFPKFNLCWTLFLDLIVRVPCNAQEYLTANYGADWDRPVDTWDWRISPPNSQLNGFWSEKERIESIYLNPKYFGSKVNSSDGESGDEKVTAGYTGE